MREQEHAACHYKHNHMTTLLYTHVTFGRNRREGTCPRWRPGLGRPQRPNKRFNRQSLRSTLIVAFIAVGFLECVLGAVLARCQDVPGSQATKNALQPLPLRESLESWYSHGNWTCANGSLYCQKYDEIGRDRNSIRWTKPLPANSEIVFDWREDGERCEGSVNPGFAINYDSASGTELDYQMANIAVRLHAPISNRNADSPPSGSWSSVSGAIKDYSKPVGEWNHSRIRCVDSRVQFWLNGSIVFDIDMEREPAEERDFRWQRMAIDNWANRERNGLYLSVICYHLNAKYGTLARIRSIGVRGLLPANELAKVEQLSPVSRFADLDWKKHDWFRQLVIPPDRLPKACRTLVPRSSFDPVVALANPGATSDKELIRVYSSYLYEEAVEDSDLTAMFVVTYQVNDLKSAVGRDTKVGDRHVRVSSRARITVTSWELASPEKAKSLYTNLAARKGKRGFRALGWRTDRCVTYLSATASVPEACFELFRMHLQRVNSMGTKR